MSWSNIKELIFQERKLLDPGASSEFPEESPFETQQNELLAWYLRTKADVDVAVSAFAQTLEWPELKTIEKFFVRARLDFAWEVVSILNTQRDGDALIAYPCPDRCTTADLLEWLFVEIWPYGCARFLQNHKAERPVAARNYQRTASSGSAKVKRVAFK